MTPEIKQVADTLGMSYSFGTYKELNHLFDREQVFPAIAEILPIKGTFGMKYGFVKDKKNVSLLILDVDKKTVDSGKTSSIVERMKSLALDFIKELNNTGRFEEIDDTDLQYYTIVKEFDKCVSGIELNVTLNPVNGRCL